MQKRGDTVRKTKGNQKVGVGVGEEKGGGVWDIIQISSSGLVHGDKPLSWKVALTLDRPEFK